MAADGLILDDLNSACKGVRIPGVVGTGRVVSSPTVLTHDVASAIYCPLTIQGSFASSRSKADLAWRMDASGETVSTIATTLGVSHATAHGDRPLSIAHSCLRITGSFSSAPHPPRR